MKLLFITHETSRTGAPMVLLHFLRWLNVNKPNVEVDVLALRGGVLEIEFKKACGNFYNYLEIVKPFKLKLWQRVLLKLGWFKKPNHKEDLLSHLSKNSYDVIYANTIVCLPLATRLSKKISNCKLVVHVHELNTIIRLSLPNLNKYLGLISHFIAPSQLVKNNLIKNWSISENDISVVYECAVIDKLKELDISYNKNKSFTVGASGTVHWRKGTNLFLQIVSQIKTKHSNCDINFMWVGKIPDNEKILLEEEIRKLNISDCLQFTGDVENPTEHYNSFDVFLMTSREDPFPLVCIEVGMLGKPIICFKDATGTEEILLNGGGFIVPYLDVEAMVNKIIIYYNNLDLVKSHGALNEKAFSKFTPEIICPKLFEIIEK